jgi:hypothetical protein
MKDLFKLAIGKEVGIGGWKCSCCSPLPTGQSRHKHKVALHKRARSRMKMELVNGIQREFASSTST